MKESNCHISSTNAWIFHGCTNTNKLYLHPLEPVWTLQDIEKTNLIICSSVVIRREMVEKAGMFHIMPHADDYDYWKRIMQHTNLIYVRDPLVGYDENHGHGKMWGVDPVPVRPLLFANSSRSHGRLQLSAPNAPLFQPSNRMQFYFK